MSGNRWHSWFMKSFFPTLAIGLCLLLIACDEGPSRPAPPPPFSHPPGPPAVAGVPVETHQSTVRLFLDHLARRESEAGWDLLSRESRALYPDIMAFARQTSELAELAADLLADPALTWTTRAVAPGAQVGVTTVSGETRREGMTDNVAFSWITRFQQGRLAIELPPQADDTLYRWENPSGTGPGGLYQSDTPLTIAFPANEEGDDNGVERVHISLDQRLSVAPMTAREKEDDTIRYTFAPDSLAPGPHVATVTWCDSELKIWYQSTAVFVVTAAPSPS